MEHTKQLSEGKLAGQNNPQDEKISLISTLLFWITPYGLSSLLLLTLFSVIYIINASIYWQAVIDDAYISFRFVDMFVQGHGWRFSPTGPRVEGMSNFLWCLLLVIPHWLSFDLMYISKIMGLASGILAVWFSYGFARALRQRNDIFNFIPPFLLATNSYFGHWALMGLETNLQTALVAAGYYRFEHERRNPSALLLSPIVAVLAAALRIDSLYFMAPLGIYAFALLFQKRIHLSWLMKWCVLFFLPLFLFWGWKYTYFGDPLPNTYYAKQRHVLNEGHNRGKEQLRIFYTDQANFEKRSVRIPKDPSSHGLATAAKAEQTTGRLFLLESNSLIWMNFWAISLLLCILGTLLPRLRPLSDQAEDDNYGSKIACMIFIPLLFHAYYVYHVNGDWMPSFRFFMVVLPFLGVAGAQGFGFAYEYTILLKLPFAARFTTLLSSSTVALFLLTGTAREQLTINSVSIYGKNQEYWGEREAFWYLPENIKENYQKGFVPPLGPVSDYLLLETQDDAWIFMSDIGQPLWFAEHLNLYDVDGLTDPFLAHAPSRRGRLPDIDDIYQDLVEEERSKNVGIIEQRTDSVQSDLLLTNTDLQRLREKARKQNFENFLERNAEYIMEHRSPEYLLIFLNHQTNNPKSKGYPYPEISREVYYHDEMENYVDDHQIPKVGNVYNHIYRRKDIQRAIPPETKLERILRAIERNPRMPSLIELLYDTWHENEIDDARLETTIKEKLLQGIERWPTNSRIIRLASSARLKGDLDLALKIAQQTIERNPTNITHYWTLSGIYEQKKDYDKALSVMKQAVELVQDNDNGVYYQLAWLFEQSGDIESAEEALRTAAERQPSSPRPYSDLGAMFERVARSPELSKEKRTEYLITARDSFEQMLEKSPDKPRHIENMISRLNRDIHRLDPASAEINQQELEAQEQLDEETGRGNIENKLRK